MSDKLQKYEPARQGLELGTNPVQWWGVKNIATPQTHVCEFGGFSPCR